VTHAPNEQSASPRELYLDLLKKCLTRSIFGEQYQLVEPGVRSIKRMLYAPVRKLLALRRLEVVRRVPFDPTLRAEGRDLPAEAETMIGAVRLDNLQMCVADVIEQKVPGDLIETGAWRGGATIFMRAILRAYSDTERVVWVADSFQGLPTPDPSLYPQDRADRSWAHAELAVSLDDVKANFERYGLLDDQVRFLRGWFRDTLPVAPIERLALLRLDGDMYESTMIGLESLYPKLSSGGYVIVDDYGALKGCRAAVDDFRREHAITEELKWIDWTGVFWKRRA
jgi:O-methyltransferase